MEILQCIRRYMDTGDWFPHLANLMKYTITAIYYITLSIYRIDRKPKIGQCSLCLHL